MFNDSFTVNFRNLTAFIVVIVRDDIAKSGRSVVRALVPNPSIAYSRRDGRVTIKAPNKNDTRTVFLHNSDAVRTTIIGVNALGDSTLLFGNDLTTHEGRVQWVKDNPQAFYGEGGTYSRLYAVKALRNAMLTAGVPVVGSLRDALSAVRAVVPYPEGY